MGWTGAWGQLLSCSRPTTLPCLLGPLLLPLLLLISPLLSGSARAQDLKEGDAVCTENHGCFVLYFQRKTFLYAWRSCKEQGGDLATLKDPEDAAAVERLFAEVNLRGKHGKIRTWIGLQRQPRQCSASRPLRGFSWVTGDQETRFVNWLGEDTPAACTMPRCVVTEYSHAPAGGDNAAADNLKWVDGPCSIPVDAYLCKYTYKGMCPSIPREGTDNTLYTTPFDMVTTKLTHLPYGSMATVPCPAETVGDQTVLCTDDGSGAVSWSRGAPYCSAKTSYCAQDNGGCHQLCIDKDDMPMCMCIEGYVLADDGLSCLPDDPCLSSPCEFECVAVAASEEGYRCDCPEGYVLEPDEQSCRDLDECLGMPCEQRCVNTAGSYECRCDDGYQLDAATGDCEDVDECAVADGADGVNAQPCENACENTPGSYVCHCHLGFMPMAEDPTRCQDIDECQIEDTCEQMCINYVGGFECYCQEGYELQGDQYSCSLIVEGHGRDPTAAVIPEYPWATAMPDPDAGAGSWNGPPWQRPPQPREEVEQEDYSPEPTDYDDWMISVTRPPHSRGGGQGQGQGVVVQSQGYYDNTDNVGQYGSFESLEPVDTESPSSSSVEMLNPGFLPGRENPIVPEMHAPAPSPSPTPDWFDDEESEEEEEEYDQTKATTIAPTTTYMEGAGNFWFAVATDKPLFPPPDSPHRPDVETGTSTTTDSPDFLSPDSSSLSPSPPMEEDEEDGVQGKGKGEGEQKGEDGEEEEEGGNGWLVGLLVGLLCIVLLAAVVLGGIYYARNSNSAAVGAGAKPQGKSNSSDCYHWISGAADKAGAEHAGAGAGAGAGTQTKSHV
ncbi:CD248 molecule, endosialin a [Engraulis encrasicolus]|uniref:CD248 molecule, endosialin a n=1 Tax=Engraulis encrasicolus TaxID=184585 RepID=UPI002FD296FB